MPLTDAERQAGRRRRLKDRIADLEARIGKAERMQAAAQEELASAREALAARDAEFDRLLTGGPPRCGECGCELACPRCYRAGDF